MSQYWVVSAMWGGQEDQSEKFIRRGYWFLGWADDEQPTQAKLRDQMQPSDRIAIKKIFGQGSPRIAIRALGAIKELDEDDKRVYVNWFVKGLEREVPSKGAYKSIHGPYTEEDPWVKEVFTFDAYVQPSHQLGPANPALRSRFGGRLWPTLGRRCKFPLNTQPSSTSSSGSTITLPG